ncbi:hypothetical protein GVAV_002833 [Gurleya vavrai]
MQELNNKTFTFYHKVKTQGRVPVEMNRSLFYLHPNARFCYDLKDKSKFNDVEFPTSKIKNQQKIILTFTKTHFTNLFSLESNPKEIWNPKHENKRKLSKVQYNGTNKIRGQQISNEKTDYIEYLSVMVIFALIIILKLVFDTYLSHLVCYFIKKKDKTYMENMEHEYTKDFQIFLVQEDVRNNENIKKKQLKLLNDRPPDKYAAKII